MTRVQVELNDAQAAALRRRSEATGQSLPAVLVGLVDQLAVEDERQRQVDMALVALERLSFRSGLTDFAENHDEYIGQALDEEVERWRR
jgi:hypothetical protein